MSTCSGALPDRGLEVSSWPAEGGAARVIANGRGRIRCLLAVLMVVLTATPGWAFGEADTLSGGDVSIAVYETVDPFNRYWWFYGDNSCEGPCSRFSAYSYEAMDVAEAKDLPALPNIVLATTGLRLEYGLLDRLTVGAEGTFVYSSDPAISSVLGDTKLQVRWRVTTEGSYVFALGGGVKLPGSYNPTSYGSPGGAQTDVEVKALFAGLALRRRLFYDVSAGYRVRIGYRNPATVVASPLIYSSANDQAGVPDYDLSESFLISGPADQVFLDAAVGFFTSRRLLFFANANIVNTTKGIYLDDYFRVIEEEGNGRPSYEVTCELCADQDTIAGNLLTLLEEDYLRLGLGALYKAFPSTTIFANYSYIAIGQNTAAFYVIPNTRIPLGSFSVGLEYTFGTREKATDRKRASRGRELADTVLSRRLNPIGIAGGH